MLPQNDKMKKSAMSSLAVGFCDTLIEEKKYCMTVGKDRHSRIAGVTVSASGLYPERRGSIPWRSTKSIILKNKKGCDFIYQYKAMKVNGKRIDEHRFIVEQTLGRKLSHDEIVHHVDGNKLNNRVKNLVVMTRSEHAAMHQKGKKNSKETREKLSEAHKNKPVFARRRFSNEEIDYIRKNYKAKSSEFGARPLSRKFGVAHSTIRKIVNREIYVI